MTQGLVAAVDGGGTKTAAALVDRRGNVRILPEAGGCNPQDGPGWDDVLDGVLRRLTREGVAQAVLGLAGLDEVPANDARLRDLVARYPVQALLLNDVALAHLGAFGGGEGVLVLSGTGSMAVARGPLGFVRVGGWGDLLGDEGSAFAIGQAGLTLAARALDGRRPDALPFARALCARLGVSEDRDGPFAPLVWVMSRPGNPRPAVAAAAPEVDALAADFAEARAILAAAAEELTLQAQVAAARAGLAAFGWCPSGGVLARSPRLRAALERQLGPAAPPLASALGGGLVEAARRAGWSPDAAFRARVEAGLRAWTATDPADPTDAPPVES